MNETYEKRKRMRMLLWRWGNTLTDITRLEHERDAFRQWADDAAETLRAQNIDCMPHGNGAKGDLSDVVVQIIRRQEMYEAQVRKTDEEIRERIRLMNAIGEHLKEMTPEQEKILAYRYSDGHRWQYIAMKMGYDERWVRRIEAQAVDELTKFIEI